MMEALDEAPSASLRSAITKESIVKALQDVLPSMNANTATLKVVMQKVAARFGMEFADLKAQWRPQIKALLPDMLDLCTGGCISENGSKKAVLDGPNKEEEEEEEALDLRPSKKRTVKKRNAIVDASDEGEDEDDANDDDASEGDEANPEDEEENDAGRDDPGEDEVAPVNDRQTARDSNRKVKRKCKEAGPPPKKSRATKQPDSAGLAMLKELGRAAGVLNPQLYKQLNKASSTAEAEEILRDRLHDAGISFAGSYPSNRDVSAARKKRAKEKELEGIDTSLIISSGRPRRGASQRISYTEERISGEEDNAEEEEEDDDDAKEDASADGSAPSDSDSSEASF